MKLLTVSKVVGGEERFVYQTVEASSTSTYSYLRIIFNVFLTSFIKPVGAVFVNNLNLISVVFEVDFKNVPNNISFI